MSVPTSISLSAPSTVEQYATFSVTGRLSYESSVALPNMPLTLYLNGTAWLSGTSGVDGSFTFRLAVRQAQATAEGIVTLEVAFPGSGSYAPASRAVDIRVTVPAVIKTYTLTLTGDPNGDYLTASGSLGEGTHTLQVGVAYLIYFRADPGYALVSWTKSGTGGTVANFKNSPQFNWTSGVEGATYTLTPILSETAQPRTYTLNASVTPAVGGTVSVPPSSSHTPGTNVYVTATPASGYEFTEWILNGMDNGSVNPFPVAMVRDQNLVAVFTPTGGGGGDPPPPPPPPPPPTPTDNFLDRLLPFKGRSMVERTLLGGIIVGGMASLARMFIPTRKAKELIDDEG